MNSFDAEPSTIETRMATMNIHSIQFNEDTYLPNIEAGNSMVKDESFYLLPSEDRDSLKFIILNRLSNNFSFIDSVHLKIAGSAYYYYLGKTILYNDKYIVTGIAQNSTGYAIGRTVIFILNKDLTLFDTRVIEPVRQLIKPRDLAINPVDGRLYLSLVYDNFDKQDSTSVPAPQYQKVVSLDSSFQIIDFWDSEAYYGGYAEAAPIAFSPTGTLYSFFTYNSFDNIIAIDPTGQEIWKTPLDSFIVVGPTTLWLTARSFSIQDMIVGSNGDILVTGGVIDSKYNIGSSSFLARLRPDGNLKWTKIFRSNNLFSVQNYGYATGFIQVLEQPDGNIVAGGGVQVYDQVLSPETPPSNEAWLLRADSNGCISPACGYIQDAVQKTNYLPIVTPANEWTVEHAELFKTSRRKYRFAPDSVLVNGKYCYELKYEDSFFGAHSTNRFYREENGIVYTSNGEVVYDLNLGTLDTMLYYYYPNQYTRTVTAVGTVVFNDSQPRKTQKVECPNTPDFQIADPITIVEGMGDLEDFFHAPFHCINPLDGPSDYIVCFSVNGQIVYMKPGESCDLTATTLPDDHTRISVYPNPADERLYIDIPALVAESAYQLRIYNTLGACILTPKMAPSSGLLTVDIARLSPGSYWGMLLGADGKTFPFAFIKKGE
jgi:outer membrane protein assembly factor BamB